MTTKSHWPLEQTPHSTVSRQACECCSAEGLTTQAQIPPDMAPEVLLSGPIRKTAVDNLSSTCEKLVL